MQVWQKFLSQKETQNVLQIIFKLKKNATSIHGEKRKMLKLIKNIKILNIDFESKAKLFSSHNDEIDFSSLIDCSIIWTEKNSLAQVWHMDALKRFAVVNIILTTNIPTEFLQEDYILKDQDNKDFDYPLRWSSIIKPNVNINSGDAIFFWSNMIHRGPESKTEERISLYLTFPLKNHIKTKITTDFAYPNWAWIDSKFKDSTTLKRSYEQIDFIRLNNLLDLYPLNWHGEMIYANVEKQIHERNQYISQFPLKNTFFLIYWSNGKSYVAKIIPYKNYISIHYFPTFEFPSKTIEKVSLENFQSLNQLEITSENIQELQGYSLTNQKGYIEKRIITQRCIVYSFTHLVLKEATEIVIPQVFFKDQIIFIHPNLIITEQ